MFVGQTVDAAEALETPIEISLQIAPCVRADHSVAGSLASALSP